MTTDNINTFSYKPLNVWPHDDNCTPLSIKHIQLPNVTINEYGFNNVYYCMYINNVHYLIFNGCLLTVELKIANLRYFQSTPNLTAETQGRYSP